MALNNPQVADQTLKGAVVGAVAFLLSKWNVDPAAQAVFIPLVTAVLAYVSTKVGDPQVASFLTKAAEETPAVVEEAKKQVAKKASAPKAPAKPAK